MNTLFNENNNLSVCLQPLIKDDFGIVCHARVETEWAVWDFSQVSPSDRYVSYANLRFLREEIGNLNYLDRFAEDSDTVFSFYPIDMFITMEAVKVDWDRLMVSMKIPMDVYTGSQINGYHVGFDFFVSADAFRDFFVRFLDDCMRLPD